MKRNLFILGLPIVAGLSLTLASCGGSAEQEGGLQQPGAAPTQITDDEEDNNVPGKVTDQDEDENEDNEDGENNNDE
ncbi:hypothetical protein [Leptolyngbya sp. FACHB-711]|jgi:hypothetical protein|uniref:hypothetical protein n=1 Tax=unclassified Leptolyngbya TaxID=2650499 RepID=UPI0016855074|nr:hypothetical protein [Leptolyngbya sp. FACHB-711]MBD1850705.1 hypothetical protein [Cyanobacteria bacterium FACHB-502]MBD2025511.1 hypothetical protein [Leptolyngbya sp. FACHB-711]